MQLTVHGAAVEQDPEAQLAQNEPLTEPRTEADRSQRRPCCCQQRHADALHWKWSESLVMYLL